MTAIQRVKTCSLCSEGIQYICKNCPDGFCENCLDEHVDGLRHVQHSIVLYRYKNSNMVIPSCNKHPSYRLDTFCRQCSVPLCLKCWTSSRTHANHTFGHMKEFIDMTRKRILSDSKKLQSDIIPGLLNESISREKRFTDAKNKFEDALQRREKAENNILDDMNKAFNEVQKRTNKKIENVLSILRNRVNQMKDAHTKAQQVLHRNRSIIHMEDDYILSEIINYQNVNKKYFTDPDHQSEIHDDPDYPIVVHGKFLILVQDVHDGAFGSHAIDLHYNSEEDTVISDGPGLLNKAFVIKTIQFKERNIFRFVHLGSALWINDYKNPMISYFELYRSSPEKSCKEIKFPESHVLHGITIINNEILYSSGTEGIFVVEGEKPKLFLSIPGWYAEGLCATSTNELLACITNLSLMEVKVIRCDPSNITSESMITQEIQFDGEHPLFHFGRNGHFIAENRNGDICVSDTNADAVIVVDRSGKFRFKYEGKVIISKRYFVPDQIITDSLSNIIVSDFINNCLHILDQNGLYLKCVDNCGLDFPLPIDIDDNGDLLVGLYLSREIKVIRYVK